LQGKTEKGDIMLALVRNSSIKIAKLVQILAQRRVFVQLEEDPEAGQALNAKMASVKSDFDPLLKAAMFRILGLSGLLPYVAKVGRRLGSASIKQVMHVVLAEAIVQGGKEHTEAALKVLRPSALKHYEEDIAVDQRLVDFFNHTYPQYAISQQLIDQANRAVETELNLRGEIDAQVEMGRNLSRRRSKFRIPDVLVESPVERDETLAYLEEYIEGELLGKAQARRPGSWFYFGLLDELMSQKFRDGRYTYDAHDANIFLTGAGEKDVLIDVGGNDEVPVEKRGALFTVF